MATQTITISAVESRFENYYREDPSDGSIVLYETYLLCPTAIIAPYSVESFTYTITLNCTDNASSTIDYTYTGTYPDSSILAFTKHTPGSTEGSWKDYYPSDRPTGGTCYLAINEDNLGLGQDFELYQLSGTITFTYSETATNKLSFGSTTPTSLYYGSSLVQKVYLGSTLVYSRSSSPTPEIKNYSIENNASNAQYRATLQTPGTYGIKITKSGSPVSLDDSMYTSVKINGVTLEVDNEKKVGSTNLTVTVVSGTIIAPTSIDIYAWIPSDQPDTVCTRASIDGYLRCNSGTRVKATWSWSDIVVAEW